VFFVSGFEFRDFDSFFVVTVVVVFVSSILLEGFPPLSTSMLDMVLFMSSGKAIPHAYYLFQINK
jgi:hypothetical protein